MLKWSAGVVPPATLAVVTLAPGMTTCPPPRVAEEEPSAARARVTLPVPLGKTGGLGTVLQLWEKSAKSARAPPAPSRRAAARTGQDKKDKGFMRGIPFQAGRWCHLSGP